MKRALQLQPNNPRYLYYSAYDGLHSAEEFVRLEAEMRAREIAGPELPGDSPEKFELLVSALQDGIRPELFLQRRPFLLEAEDFLRRAIDAAPTVARYHATLASVTAELEPASTLALLRAETAGAFAPNKPGILYNAGRIFLAQAPAGKRRDKANRAPDMAYEYFRRAMFADPSYSGRIYSLVESTGGGRSDLMSVTPQTISAYERLCSHLWKSEDWDGVLACVEMIEGLVDSRSTLSPFSVFSQRNAEAFQRYNPGDYGWGSPIRGAVGFDHRDPLLIKLSSARRRCAVLGIQGRWSERSEAVSHYRTILREHLAGKTAEARRLRGLGRHKEAMTICLDILQQDWAGPEVLLEAAELASLPRALDYAPEWNAPLDHLYRLVINNTELSPAEYERATHMLNGAVARDASDELAAEFVRGAGAVLVGRIDEGVEILATLAARRDETARYWRQGHLIWYYLGQGYEKMGRKTDAIKAYTRTIEIIPTHRSALLRLNELAGSETAFFAERLASLTPEVPLDIDFGGKIKLLGYTFGKKTAPAETNGAAPDREGWLITCYWQFNDRMSQGYRPAIHFCDEQWGNLFHKYSPVRGNNKPYPVDFPRCGEVIVEKHLVNHDLSKARYLRVGIWTATPERFIPEVLHYDAGKGLVRAALPHAGQRVRSELLAGRT
ncbi:MAG: tetratricopeptide repeat protein [Candidatus Abyssubacteria bacterium]|nr:tetratricopeptide repeat protein [Candidatus Abyssubacteria bacterium]